MTGAIKDALKSIKKIVDDEHKQIMLISRMLKDNEPNKNQSFEFFLINLKEN